jgi:hypothetical protein
VEIRKLRGAARHVVIVAGSERSAVVNFSGNCAQALIGAILFMAHGALSPKSQYQRDISDEEANGTKDQLA